MKKYLQKSILISILALFLGLVITSCSRDKDEDQTYTARLYIKHQSSNPRNSTANGSVFFNDATGNRQQISLRSNIEENISFEVRKGYESSVEIRATDINGNLVVRWTVTNNSTGVVVQDWGTDFTSQMGDSLTDSYKNQVW